MCTTTFTRGSVEPATAKALQAGRRPHRRMYRSVGLRRRSIRLTTSVQNSTPVAIVGIGSPRERALSTGGIRSCAAGRRSWRPPYRHWRLAVDKIEPLLTEQIRAAVRSFSFLGGPRDDTDAREQRIMDPLSACYGAVTSEDASRPNAVRVPLRLYRGWSCRPRRAPGPVSAPRSSSVVACRYRSGNCGK